MALYEVKLWEIPPGSIRILSAWPHNPDPVVGEFRVEAWEFVFGHVTGNTFTGGHRAGCSGMLVSHLESRLAQVTTEAEL